MSHFMNFFDISDLQEDLSSQLVNSFEELVSEEHENEFNISLNLTWSVTGDLNLNSSLESLGWSDEDDFEEVEVVEED